jgi:putative membrane protein
MKLSIVLGTALGLALLLTLGAHYGFADIASGLGNVGWGVLAVIAFHPLQIIFSALGWQVLVEEGLPPRLIAYAGLRCIREGVNNLLPVAQIGGELVGARLLRHCGMPLAVGGASVIVDLSMEASSQIVFTIIGLALLIPILPEPGIMPWAIAGITLAGAVVGVFIAAQRIGLFHVFERGLVRLAERGAAWSSLADIAGLHRAIAALYAAPARLGRSFGYHLISWLLGGFEVMLALHLVGVSVDFRAGLIIEALGQALRAVGFAIPASLGIQEGGYVLACGLFGVSPQAAIELSLLKRIREVALGVPALILWQVIEMRQLLDHLGAAASASAGAEGE